MTKLAVVAYPTLATHDREWLEAVRSRHDPQASRIRAHFTFVFPTEVPRESLIANARTVAARLKPIPFALRCAVAFGETGRSGSHVFLLAEEGRDELLEVHDRLHAGVLQPHLRQDVPFVPHMTVGAHGNLAECERVAEELNREHRVVRGMVDGVHVIEVDERTVRTVAEFPLGGSPSLAVPQTDPSRCSPPPADRER